MAWFSQFRSLLLLFSWYQAVSCQIEHPLTSTVVLINKVTTASEIIRNFQNALKEVTLTSTTVNLLELMNRKIYNDLRALSNNVHDVKEKTIYRILQKLQDKTTAMIDEFFKLVADVESAYEKFMKFLDNADKYEKVTLLRFATSSTSPSQTELQRTLERLHELFHYENYMGESFISILIRHSNVNDIVCLKNQSQQQMIHEIYETLIDSTVKGMLITLFSYSLRSKDEKLSFTFEREEATQMFEARIYKDFEYFKKSISAASREIWKCDPPKHRQYVTYGKLEEVFQAFIVNDKDIADMSPTSRLNFKLSRTCDSIKDARLQCTTQACNDQPESAKCSGHLRDCQLMPKIVQICYSKPQSERRYDWARQDIQQDVAIYGKYNRRCKNRTQIYQANGTTNNLCMCTCEKEERVADHYFSLLDVESDYDKIVTGVKLIKQHGVFHIQIQQGTLGVNGTIADELKWKDANNMRIQRLFGSEIAKTRSRWVEYYQNTLVYSVTYEQRYVQLDTLISSSGRLMTGLRFKQVGYSLVLEIQATPFDFETGTLYRDASFWQSSARIGLHNRDEVILTKPRNPAELYGHDDIVSDNKYVQFRMTDLETDVGSYTVPFLDLQEVTTEPPMPLSGAGLIYRGKSNSGGFLGFKLIHYDFNGHL